MAQIEPKRSRGRPAKYPIHRLEVGESVTLPWVGWTMRDRCLWAQRVANSVCKEQRVRGKRFIKSGSYQGMVITRVK